MFLSGIGLDGIGVHTRATNAGIKNVRPGCRRRAAGAFRSGSVSTSMTLTRRRLLQLGLGQALVWTLSGLAWDKARAANEKDVPELPFPVQVLEKGTGPQPQTGDLVGIRFRAAYNGRVFDDIMDSSEPFYMRVGSGNLVKGVEEAVKRMHVGDLWRLELPPAYAFGSKGRKPSPGKPAIPPNATVVYEVRLDEVPGREQELLEVTGGELREND
ncbi:probable FKBP-type peptidyl-prolyl cis-trans isomerase [Cyanidioschyzon merolae strain 10D]|jgi:hypothetical protein|uniref:peptidylprolyl isomerase n=1 Tax=Cyanidioschyzon merolae (strain NIES-3377 / 10D) TaxID=280699 RepID=M1V457_CYAM1|nr:probable FKBP-type peptidyl-prolyl cis-trans isomerase [Cyanidioschyzon merolae strain 10D]BAM79150.1 probable FKBP-type peptidyl-prolyl cis-trans isomerase [Cyanidioschyzon merolae strain 10D]|eukprot:XP_005535436.1 probable FKBP-type peptidyl-prolyl cis-trans isomerase [Cyanidioschyzon merolae strain 10D]